MHNKISFIFIMIIMSATNTSFAKEPTNLYFVKANLVKYHDSGEYLKDQTRVTDSALLYLKNLLASEKQHPSGKKLALVLDIDDTSLSNYPDMSKARFCETTDEFGMAINKGDDPAISPTLKLFRYAKANHIAVFFITGRTEKFREPTIKNLNAVGYQNWDGLTFKPENYSQPSIAPFKTDARKQIEDQGYQIILNVGDQESDLIGKHAKKTFKFPNPYYFLP